MDHKSIMRLTQSLSAVIDRPHALMIAIISMVDTEKEKLTTPCIAEHLNYDRSSTTIETLVSKLVKHEYLVRDETYQRMRFISLSQKTISLIK